MSCKLFEILPSCLVPLYLLVAQTVEPFASLPPCSSMSIFPFPAPHAIHLTSNQSKPSRRYTNSTPSAPGCCLLTLQSKLGTPQPHIFSILRLQEGCVSVLLQVALSPHIVRCLRLKGVCGSFERGAKWDGFVGMSILGCELEEVSPFPAFQE